jgi:hypothetical protein
MPGAWLERIAAAFADLAFEHSRGWRLAAAYAGIACAIAGALRFQFTTGAQALLADDARLLALRYDAATIGTILLVQIVYHAGLLLLFLDFQR